MTLAVMPSILFGMLRGSWSLDPHDPQLRTDFDAGPARQRKRFTNSPSYISFTGIARKDLFPLFKAFYHNEINDGTDWFTATVWDGDTYTQRTVRFREPYKVSDTTKGNASISFSLEMKPVYLSPSAYEDGIEAEENRILIYEAEKLLREQDNAEAAAELAALIAELKAAALAKRAAEIAEAWDKWLRLLFVRTTYGDLTFYNWGIGIHHSINAAEGDPISFQDSMGLIIPLYN